MAEFAAFVLCSLVVGAGAVAGTFIGFVGAGYLASAILGDVWGI